MLGQRLELGAGDHVAAAAVVVQGGGDPGAQHDAEQGGGRGDQHRPAAGPWPQLGDGRVGVAARTTRSSCRTGGVGGTGCVVVGTGELELVGDPVPDPGRRRFRLVGGLDVTSGGHDRAQLVELGLALRALREVGVVDAFRPLAEGEQGEVVGISVRRHRPPPAGSGAGRSDRRMWLFTVPSGMLSRLAIWVWVRSS